MTDPTDFRDLTVAQVLAEIIARKEEAHAWLCKWISARDAAYRQREKQIKNAKPIRHPGGYDYPKHDRMYLWNDALWCQDVGSSWFEEFLCCKMEYDESFDGGPAGLQEVSIGMFDEAFRKVMPKKFHKCLEG